MKIRLMGTREEIDTVLPELGAVLKVVEISDFYPNRGASQLGRVYLEVHGTRTQSDEGGDVMRVRVWLADRLTETEVPSPAAVGVFAVRDDQLRVWCVDRDDCWHTADDRHHATWQELHARFDLVEVRIDE